VIATDAQTGGIIGLAGLVIGVILAMAKGSWEIYSGARKDRRDQKQGDAATVKSLHDAAQEGIMAFNEILKADNDRLRTDLGKANTRIDELEDEIQSLRVTVAELTGRLARLEGSDGR